MYAGSTISTPLRTYTGHQPPSTFVYYGTELSIVFTGSSSAQVSDTGFAATYTAAVAPGDV